MRLIFVFAFYYGFRVGSYFLNLAQDFSSLIQPMSVLPIPDAFNVSPKMEENLIYIYKTFDYGNEDRLMHIPGGSLTRCILFTLQGYRPEELDGVFTTLWTERGDAPFYSKVMESELYQESFNQHLEKERAFHKQLLELERYKAREAELNSIMERFHEKKMEQALRLRQPFPDPIDLYTTQNSSIRKAIEAQQNEELRKILRGE